MAQLKQPEFCDFCHDTSTPWTYSCSQEFSIVVVHSQTQKKIIQTFDPHWSACDRCSALIANRELQLLVNRVAAMEKSDFNHMLILKAMYEEFFRLLVVGPVPTETFLAEHTQHAE